MSELPSAPEEIIQVKPQSNVYTLMLIITILALGTAIGFVLHKLMSPVAAGGYAMDLNQIFFEPLKIP